MSKARLVGLIGVPATTIVLAVVPKVEGTILRGYRDPIGVVTACTGHTKTAVLGRPYSREECEKLLVEDLIAHAEPVLRCAGTLEQLGTYRMAAAVSFTFNVGGPAFCASTFARRLKAGDPNACEEISRWIMADGKDCRIRANNCYGIVDRRVLERSICEGNIA